MGQTPAKGTQNHISPTLGVGYTTDAKLALKLRNSLTKLNLTSDQEEQLLRSLLVLNAIQSADPESKQEIQHHLSLSRPKFFLNCYNGSHIVLPLLFRLGWNRIMDRADIGQCCFRWTETVMQLNYQVFREGEQMVNHIPNCGLFTNKLGLLMSLRNYAKRKHVTVSFIPETYWIDDAKEKAEFVRKLNDHQIWLMKPCGLNRGKGICLIRSPRDFMKLDEARSEAFRRNPQMCRSRIVQRYITFPLLLNGRKFDIRCYLMIASTMPYLVIFTPGYIRLSLRKYDCADTNPVTHLTNQFIQKKDPSYDKSKDDSVWTIKKLNEYINTNVAPIKHLPKNWVARHMIPEMRRITTEVFNSVKDKLACRIGFFEIYGMDFMVDDDMKVWLIEINSNPAMSTNCGSLRQVIPPIISRFIRICIECFEKARRWRPLLPIFGILPRNSSLVDAESYSPSWTVSLRSSQKHSTNSGLPASFTVLINESLSSAKTRQSRCYNMPLRLWLPPKVDLNVYLLKPGLVIQRSGSLSSQSSISTLRPSIPVSTAPITGPTRSGSQKPPSHGLRAIKLVHSSSSSNRANSRSEEIKTISVATQHEPFISKQIGVNLVAKPISISDKTGLKDVTEKIISRQKKHNLFEVVKE